MSAGAGRCAVVVLAMALLGPGCLFGDEPTLWPDVDDVFSDGGPIPCEDAPAADERFQVQKGCWAFSVDDPELNLYYIGASTDDGYHGVVIMFDDASTADDEYDPYYWTVEREGAVTIFYASLKVVCFTTAKDGAREPQGMHVSPFEWKQRRFLLPAEARRRCPSTGPVTVEELAEPG